MGRNMGRLGAQRDPLDLEFTYFDDQVIRVHPYATDSVEVDFLEAGKDLGLEEIMEMDLRQFDSMNPDDQVKVLQTLTRAQRAGYLALTEALRKLIHPDDYDRYWKLGNENGQQVRDRMADIKAITGWVIDATTGFPTQPPSDSDGGQSTTLPSSEDDSHSPVQQSAEVQDWQAAMALNRGRPDLQEFFLIEEEHRQMVVREEQQQAARDQAKLRQAGLA